MAPLCRQSFGTVERTIEHSDGGAVAAARPVTVRPGLVELLRIGGRARRLLRDPLLVAPVGRVLRRSAAVGGERRLPIAFEATIPKLEVPLGAPAEAVRADHTGPA